MNCIIETTNKAIKELQIQIKSELLQTFANKYDPLKTIEDI